MCCGCDDEVALVVSQLTPQRGTKYRASPSGAAGVVPAHTLVALLRYHREDDSVHAFAPHGLAVEQEIGRAARPRLAPNLQIM